VRLKLEDGRTDSAETTLHVKKLRQELRLLLRELNTQQRTVVTLRFGLENASPSTLAEIGKRLQVSRERVRQIEQGAIRWLRNSLIRTRRLCAAKDHDSTVSHPLKTGCPSVRSPLADR
jgi:DNA-directed RNA polymerase sigma subunit (sigma70/sigma32)